MKVLGSEELRGLLKEQPGWIADGKTLTMTKSFPDFAGSIRFVNEAAAIAEEMGHHPDLHIHYNQVDVTLSTHDSGGVTALDVALAKRLSTL